MSEPNYSIIPQSNAETGLATPLSSQNNSLGDSSPFNITAFNQIQERDLSLECQVATPLDLPVPIDSRETLLIITVLSTYISPFLARRIGVFLEPYLTTRGFPVTDLRAIVIPPLTNGGQPWPIVQWKEFNISQMAIFTTDPILGILSCLFHTIIPNEQNGIPLTCSEITWYLMEMDHLVDMLAVIHHLFDMSKWQDLDLVGQLFDLTQSICTVETYEP